MQKYLVLILTFAILSLLGNTTAQEDVFIYGDALPDAPILAYRGYFDVGVRTISVINPDQVDILSDETDALYDRELTLEIWYPADLSEGESELFVYDQVMGTADDPDTIVPITFLGRAARDATPLYPDDAYPLIIVSHGYPGSRLQMTYLTENLASKGYVVVAIDHMESTFLDKANTNSTLLNRAFDQEFVLNEIAEFSETDEFFIGLVDANNTAIIAYSMGGYGALNTIGAGYNPLLGFTVGAPIRPRIAGFPDYQDALDTRIKAVVLFAPFGGNLSSQGLPGVSMWLPAAMANITVPTFWFVGSEDDLAIAAAVNRLFDESINSERYLLTYQGAGHNIAPNPPPPEATSLTEYQRWTDSVWEEQHINNLNQHFVTAFLNLYLKSDETMRPYIEPTVEIAADGVYSVDDEGNFAENHSYWEGFLPRTAMGLELRYETP